MKTKLDEMKEYRVDDIVKEADRIFGNPKFQSKKWKEQLSFILKYTDYSKGFRFDRTPEEFLMERHIRQDYLEFMRKVKAKQKMKGGFV